MFPENPVRYVGLKLPTNIERGRSGGVFSMSTSTEDQAVSNYVNLLLTMPGERYMQPTFGVGLQRYLFEQNSEALQTMIELAIEQQSALWLPYIYNHSIEVFTSDDDPTVGAESDHVVRVKITFSVTERGAKKSVIFYTQDGIINVIVE